MDPLFPALPDDLSALSREDLQALLEEHLEAQRLIRSQDADFLGDLSAAQIIEQAEAGKAQTAALRSALEVIEQAEANFEGRLAELTSDVAESDEDDDDEDGDDAEVAELSAEVADDAAEEIEETEEEAVTAAAILRRPPAPSKKRAGVQVEEVAPRAVLVAAAGNDSVRAGEELDANSLAAVVIEKARRLGKPTKSVHGVEERHLLASASFPFPEERILRHDDLTGNTAKMRALRNTEGQSLVASGGLCAPLTPFYDIPNFAVASRPVRAALPSFRADRGGVNVPVPTTLASADGAITIITEADDALGGTFATKSCLDQTCLSFVETAVTIISHCREYGNLNSRAWPESVAFENALTMAQHARVAESYLLDRIKAQSINVTTADVYSSTHDLIYAITRAASAVRYRLRTGENVRLRALLPSWVTDMMVADVAATQFDRFISRARATQILRDAGVEPSFYIDTPNTGTTQGFADEAAGALDDFPDVVQYALYVEGAFIHVDGGSLELGLVRDSTLNSTNDYQMFGETFENVALLGPAQSALWITSTVCPSGEFPALTTALSC